MSMTEDREARLRNAVARLINAGLHAKVPHDDEPPVDAEDLFVWEVIKTIRNTAFNDARSALDAMRHQN
uniref:Uncharacterized protein n=1 Tax=Streptomyces sp. NBC_01393 TaxID=2903851 RepID=A0AAU3IDK2_9ACTN